MQQDVKQGYKNEILYQKHMLENLLRWSKLMIFLSTIGILIIYFYHSNTPLFILGLVVTILSILGFLIFSLGIYNGRKNINKVIDAFQKLNP